MSCSARGRLLGRRSLESAAAPRQRITVREVQDVQETLDREVNHWMKRAYLIIIGLCSLYRILMPSMLVLLIFAATPRSALDSNPRARNSQSIITEWDLTESRAWIPGLLQSLYYVGFMPGTIIFGQLSDLYGRRSVAWKAYTALLLIQIISGFCQSWKQFAACRVIHGAISGGLSVVDTILLQEISGSELWPLNGILGSVQFSVNMFVYIIFAYYFPSWRTLYFVTVVPGLLGFLYFLVAPESPRWLATKGKLAEAEKSLAWIAKLNGLDDNDYQLLVNENECNGNNTIERADGNDQEEETNGDTTSPSTSGHPHLVSEIERNGNSVSEGPRRGVIGPDARSCETNSVLDLVRKPILRSRTAIMGFQWFTASLVFYGITLGSGSFSKNFYVAYIVSDLSGLPALPFMMYMIGRPWGGRRRTLAVCTSLGAIATFSTYLFRFSGENSNYKLTFLFVGKLGMSAGFDLVYIFTAEMYPTVVRNVGLGAMSFCARIGGIAAPFLVNDTVFSDPYVPYLWYGLLCGLCAALALYLPETRDGRPQDRIEDLQEEES